MSIDPVTLKCLKYIQTACLGSDVFVHTGAMSLFVFLRPTTFSETYRLPN